MNYRKEARNKLQSLYGGYCEMCRTLGLDYSSYQNFTLKDYNKVKQLMKTHKKNKKSQYKHYKDLCFKLKIEPVERKDFTPFLLTRIKSIYKLGMPFLTEIHNKNQYYYRNIIKSE